MRRRGWWVRLGLCAAGAGLSGGGNGFVWVRFLRAIRVFGSASAEKWVRLVNFFRASRSIFSRSWPSPVDRALQRLSVDGRPSQDGATRVCHPVREGGGAERLVRGSVWVCFFAGTELEIAPVRKFGSARLLFFVHIGLFFPC